MEIDFQSIETPSTSSEDDKNEDEIIKINEEYENNNINDKNLLNGNKNLEHRYHNWHSGIIGFGKDISPMTSIFSHYESPGKWLNMNTTRAGANHHYVNGIALRENLLRQESIFLDEVDGKSSNDDDEDDDEDKPNGYEVDILIVNDNDNDDNDEHIDYNHNTIINEQTYSNKYPLSMHNRIYVNGASNHYYHNPRHPNNNPNHHLHPKTILSTNTIVNKCYDLL